MKTLNKCIFLICLLTIVSCNDLDLETPTSLETSSYKLSDLNDHIPFAQPITSTDDLRHFSIETAAFGKLEFELKTQDKITVNGKSCTLTGVVNHGGKKERAVLTVADNGFLLLFVKDGTPYTIRKQEVLNLGIKNTSETFKDIYTSLDKKSTEFRGSILEKTLLNKINTNKTAPITTNRNVLEKGEGVYSLMQYHTGTGSEANCSNVFENAKNSALKRVSQKSSPPPYTIAHPLIIEIVNKDNGYDFDTQFSYFVLSLFTVINQAQTDYPNIQFSAISFENRDYTQITSSLTQSEHLFFYLDLIGAITKVDDPFIQVNNLVKFYNKHIVSANRPDEFYRIKVSCYNNAWNGGVKGRAQGVFGRYTDFIALGTQIGNPSLFASHANTSGGFSIISPYSPIVLGHEIGHNFDVPHSNNINDIMYSSVDPTPIGIFHLNPLFITAIIDVLYD